VTRTDITHAQFEDLFRRYSPEVHSYLRRRVGDDADDLLSEVFIVAWERRRDLPGGDKQRAWLYGVARNLILSGARNKARSRAATREHTHSLRPTSDVESGTDATDRTVRAALKSLTDVDQELIMLTTWERLSVTDAATVMGLRPGAARVRLHRARQRLAAHPAMQDLVRSAQTETR
jgi:RNA polymerase sigma-70 factor (ECF subfamily)